MIRFLRFCLVIVTSIISSCASSDKPDEDRIEQTIRKGLEDFAFKRSQKCTIYELRLISVSNVGDAYHLKTKSQFFSKAFDFHMKRARDFREIAQSQLNLAEGYKRFDIPSESNELEAKTYLSDAQAYLDSAKLYASFDSIVQEKLKKVDNDSTKYFKVKAFLKATVGDQNMLDTMYYLIDKNYVLLTNEAP